MISFLGYPLSSWSTGTPTFRPPAATSLQFVVFLRRPNVLAIWSINGLYCRFNNTLERNMSNKVRPWFKIIYDAIVNHLIIFFWIKLYTVLGYKLIVHVIHSKSVSFVSYFPWSLCPYAYNFLSYCTYSVPVLHFVAIASLQQVFLCHSICMYVTP